MSDEKKVKVESVARVALFPWWLGLVFLWLFVKGCFAGGCTAQGGMTEVLRTCRQSWEDSAPEEPK